MAARSKSFTTDTHVANLENAKHDKDVHFIAYILIFTSQDTRPTNSGQKDPPEAAAWVKLELSMSSPTGTSCDNEVEEEASANKDSRAATRRRRARFSDSRAVKVWTLLVSTFGAIQVSVWSLSDEVLFDGLIGRGIFSWRHARFSGVCCWPAAKGPRSRTPRSSACDMNVLMFAWFC